MEEDLRERADGYDPSRTTKARDFEGEGGPEEKRRTHEEERGGDDDVRGNVRQGGETIRPSG